MRPKKEEYYHKKQSELPNEQSKTKVRYYTLVFKDKPDIKHKIIISQNDKLFTYDIRFSKALLHPVTNTIITTNSLICSNLPELKELLRGYLNAFGEYIIKPE